MTPLIDSQGANFPVRRRLGDSVVGTEKFAVGPLPRPLATFLLPARNG